VAVKVASTADADRHAWDAYVAGVPMNLPMNRYAWKEVLERSYGVKTLFLAAEDEDGQVCGVLPTYMTTGFNGTEGVFSLKGGLLAENDEAPSTWFKLLIGAPVVTSGPLSGRDASYFDRVTETVEHLELGDRVEVVKGFIDSAEEFMKLADVYVLPSTSEGLPNPLLEAVACGVPIVANRVEGITDTWINPGKNGFVSALDAREFADRVTVAVQIPAATLAEESRQALAAASTEVIDGQYMDRIKAIVGLEQS
jgi:hypothetical protein